MTHRLLLAITMLLSLALPAMAADGVHSFDDFAIPNPTRPETARTLLTVDTSEHAGETCQIVVDTANGPSVHPENYLTVEGGIPTITVTGTEDSDGGVHQSTSTVVMGDELHVVNHFALATSVEGRITIRCQPDSTTTTITSPPSTTSSSTPPTTSVPDTSSSTSPPDSSTSSTSPASSTSSSVSPPSTTIPPVSNPPATLPVTGPDGLVGWAVAAAAMLLLGGSLVAAAREGEG